MVFLKEFFEKVDFEKNKYQQHYALAEELVSGPKWARIAHLDENDHGMLYSHSESSCCQDVSLVTKFHKSFKLYW